MSEQNLYTAFCRAKDNTGPTWIEVVQGIDMQSAQATAKLQCATAWGVGFDDIHCLGLARGEIDIEYWEDLNE